MTHWTSWLDSTIEWVDKERQMVKFCLDEKTKHCAGERLKQTELGREGLSSR